MTVSVHPVDEVLPAPRLLALGLQHVLVMYAGAVAVPLIIGRALKLPPQDVAFLISADLFACGLATLVQCIGFPGVGIRLPVMMGVTFASVGPMLSMAAAPEIGLLGIYGSVIAAGIFGIIVAPFISRLLPLFPPVVTGTIIMVIGISLMRVGINWAGGGLPVLTRVIDGVPHTYANPGYGQLQGLGIALFVLCVILALIKWGTGFLANVSVLLGIIAGAILASLLGVMHFDKVGTAGWVDIGPARRRRRHASWRHLQHLPLHVVLAECRSGRRHRRALALGDHRRWRHHAGARPAAEDGRAGGGRTAGGARRRRPRDVRHGRRDRRPHPHRGGFQDQPAQPVRGRDFRRLRPDPAGGAELLQGAAA